MSETISYSLEFLIDETQVNSDDLKKTVASVLSKHVLSVDWQVIQTPSQHFKLSIKGSLKDVDTCHDRINKKFVNRYSCIRLRDEAGNEIRHQAYPILAHIEQQLRTFINRAMIEVNGFDWWNSMTAFLTDRGIRDKVEKRMGKPSSGLHHPLELTLFEELIRIVTGSIQYWSTGKPLSAGDLLEILSDCSSLEDVQKKLAEKTRKVSLWDEVFARYFDDVDKWKALTKIFTDFVIDVRNRVMHHRPMHLWELRKLQKTKQSIDTLLASAVGELSEQGRAEARKVSEEWSRAVAHRLDELIPSTFPTAGNIIAPLLKQQADLSQMLSGVLSEAVALPTLPAVGNIMEPFLKLQEELSQMLSGVLSEAVALPTLPAVGSIMEPFLKLQEELSRAFREQISGNAVQQLVKSVQDQQEQVGRAMAQLAASNTVYGSSDSIRFHHLTCRYVNRILPENLIRFADRDEAVAEGYVPCGTCKP